MGPGYIGRKIPGTSDNTNQSHFSNWGGSFISSFRQQTNIKGDNQAFSITIKLSWSTTEPTKWPGYSDQPAHLPSLIRSACAYAQLIRGSAVYMKRLWVLSYPICAQQRLIRQIDLSLRWAHKLFCWFCHALAQMTLQHTKWDPSETLYSLRIGIFFQQYSLQYFIFYNTSWHSRKFRVLGDFFETWNIFIW